MSAPRLHRCIDMLRLQAERFTRAMSDLSGVASTLHASIYQNIERCESATDERMTKEWAFAKTKLEHLQKHCTAYDVRISGLAIKRLLDNWDDEYAAKQPIQAAANLSDIGIRIYDELSLKHFFVLGAAESQMYKGDYFTHEILAAFPSTTEDLEEACKCIAFGRYTASVFHLMRAMEFAVQALASELKIANVARDWGKLLSDMSKQIEPMPKSPERDRWSESHSHLYHVKQAWRNDVMHPKATYTEEQAEDVIRAVRSFMKHLAPLVSA